MLPGRDSCPLFLPKKPVFPLEKSRNQVMSSREAGKGLCLCIKSFFLHVQTANNSYKWNKQGKVRFFIVSCNPFSLYQRRLGLCAFTAHRRATIRMQLDVRLDLCGGWHSPTKNGEATWSGMQPNRPHARHTHRVMTNQKKVKDGY